METHGPAKYDCPECGKGLMNVYGLQGCQMPWNELKIAETCLPTTRVKLSVFHHITSGITAYRPTCGYTPARSRTSASIAPGRASPSRPSGDTRTGPTSRRSRWNKCRRHRMRQKSRQSEFRRVICLTVQKEVLRKWAILTSYAKLNSLSCRGCFHRNRATYYCNMLPQNSKQKYVIQ